MSAILIAILFALLGFHGQDASSKAQSSILWHEGDPSRVECYDSSKPKRDWPLPGPECAKQVFAKFGEPFMFPAHNGISYGISAAPDDAATLSLWADNQTPTSQDFLMCCISTVLNHIDVHDERGRRIPSESDKMKQKSQAEGTPTIEVCSCSGWVSIPPHVIAYLGSAKLSDGYVLPAGKYIISERWPPSKTSFSTESNGKPPEGLSVSIP
jgi:hypothetical protein